jgi:hypothetical protein
MIEVIGDINELHVCEAEKEEGCEKTVEPAKRDGCRSNCHGDKNGIHPHSRKWLYPGKTEVAEVEDWIYQLSIDPAHGHVPQGAE